MTDNAIISKWRGECRHEGHHYENGRYGGWSKCHTCGREDDDQYRFMNDVINYDSDPSAWDDELYQKIEDAGLWMDFVRFLRYQVANYISDSTLVYWRFLKASPAQKASALAKAIGGCDGL